MLLETSFSHNCKIFVITNKILTKYQNFSLECLHTKIGFVQRILDEISRQLDDYELSYGPIDRTEFEGEFYVPVEIRNRINSSKGSLRIHGGLLTISRSRTFLSLSSGNRSSIHNSTPDLSRSVPNTPGSNHKLSLTSSYDSVLEENEEDGVVIVRKGMGKNHKSKSKHVQQIFGSSNMQNRRKSEDLLESSRGSSNVSSLIAVQKQQHHVRQSSDQAYRLIPRVKHSVNTSTSNSSCDLDSEIIIKPKWGNVRGSNSFAADMNISSLSTYTIPRVSLGHNTVNKLTDPSKASYKSSPENSTFVMRHHDNEDSVA